MEDYDNNHILIVDDNEDIHNDFRKILIKKKNKHKDLNILEKSLFNTNDTNNVIEKAGEYIGRAVSNLCNVFAPGGVIIGSEFIEEEGLFFRVIERAFRSNIIDIYSDCVLQPGLLKNKAALIGAGDISFGKCFDRK